MSRRGRRPWAVVAVAAALSLLAGAGWIGRREYVRQRGQAELATAKAALEAGDLARARRALVAADNDWEGRGEVLYLLGACEEAAGRTDDADRAWARVPADSPFAATAALRRARLALDRDRLAAAEALLPAAIAAPGELGREARDYLLYLYRLQGRLADAARVVREGWARGDKVKLLQESWRLDPDRYLDPAEQARVADDAARNAPDDDRVGLVRAVALTRAGRYDDASQHLLACRSRRPDDPVVWRAWLDLGRAEGHAAKVREALPHLPADRLPPTDALAVAAWLAERAGDAGRERAALAELVGRTPGDAKAIDRLVALCVAAGDADEAARLRERQAELGRTRALYVPTAHRADPTPQARDLARWAETLGRWFEAKGWWELAGVGLGDAEARIALARIARAEAQAAAPGPSPADLLAEFPAGRAAATATASASGAGSVPRFDDEAEAAGLRFTYDSGRSDLRQMPETMGSGVGLLDFDGDGRLDLYCTQGGPFPPPADAPLTGDRLFRNRGDGTFEDATESSGLAGFPRGYGHGVTVGDIDNDGHPDLFVTRWRSYSLYRNRGDGTFEDVTESTGLGGDRGWPTSAAFADLDEDGDPDLYVCHYADWDAERPMLCPDPTRDGRNFICIPKRVPAQRDRLFRNDGGRFVDVTDEAGVADADTDGRGLGVVACDLDDDGLIDLYVANDMTANYLFKNLGGMRFAEVGHAAGVAAGGEGAYQASMGIACADLDGDGRPDLAVTNFYNEGTTLYRNLGGGLFADATAEAGLAPARGVLGFGIAAIDADDDGHLDLASANGHVDDYRPAIPFAMPMQLYRGTGGGRLVEVGGSAGAAFARERVGRSLAAGDLDDDGRIDLVVASLDEPLAWFRNRTEGGRSLTLAPEGTDSGRDAVGARVRVTADGRTQTAWKVGGGSYQSAGDPRLHFGLGRAARAESVEIRWPSGRIEQFGPLDAGRVHHLREGAGERPQAARPAALVR